ncbi:MAG: type II toxin-antitoxin system HicA family toxin [Deltaproteobacteria bacterium]|nr:type II toxin-antitoxin system HicA family toxin [Deltaproteobacteria bacterium]
MGNIQKLFDKAKNNPHDVRFDDMCRLAEHFGFTCRGGKGSHRVYTRKGIYEILNFQNVKGKTKPYQVRQFLKIIENYNLTIKGE